MLSMSGGDLFFFFKQKTAYEMRISDWSSDVCSSDLTGVAHANCQAHAHAPPPGRVKKVASGRPGRAWRRPRGRGGPGRAAAACARMARVKRCWPLRLYSMPVSSLADSDIMLRLHGGPETRSTSGSATVGHISRRSGEDTSELQSL